MTHHSTNPTSRAAVLAIAVVLTALSGFYAYTSLVPTAAGSEVLEGRPPGQLSIDGDRRDDGGRISGGVTVHDDVSAVANLRPELLRALRAAASAAADDGVEVQVNSGWRSVGYQEQLLRAAVSKYGSQQEAARWVATPKTSPHVSGDAVDIGRTDAMAWMSHHGAAFGLCQIYSNEPWHFELRPDAADQRCPAMYADPTQDPRMRQ